MKTEIDHKKSLFNVPKLQTLNLTENSDKD